MTIPLTLLLTAGFCGVVFMLLELRDAPEGFEDEGGFHYAWRNNSPEVSNISCIWDHTPAASPGPARRAA